MKKVLPFLLIGIVAVIGFVVYALQGSDGRVEATVEKVVFVSGGADYEMGDYEQVYRDFYLKRFTESTGIPVEFIAKGSLDGSTQELDLMIMSGEQVDVMMDFALRTSKYAREGIAVDLTEHFDEATLENFHPSIIEAFYSGDALYSVPETAWAVAFGLNVTLAEELGLEIPTEMNWSLDTWREMTEAVLDTEDAWGTVIHAAHSSGDYFHLGWFLANGARMYDEVGNFTFDSDAALETLQWLVSLQERGVIPSGVAGMSHGEFYGLWSTGRVLGAPLTYGQIAPSGMPDGNFEVVPMAIPHAEGAPPTPAVYGYDSILVFDHDSIPRDAAAKLVEWLVSPEAQSLRVVEGMRYPSVRGTGRPDDPVWEGIYQVIEENGVANLGYAYTWGALLREKWFPTLQAAFSGELTPEEALDRFTDEAERLIP